MQKFSIDTADFESLKTIQAIAQKLQVEWGQVFFDETELMTDETLGKIAACGQGDGALCIVGSSLHEINGQDANWINGRWAGLELIRLIASSAVLAEVCNEIEDKHPLSMALKRR